MSCNQGKTGAPELVQRPCIPGEGPHCHSPGDYLDPYQQVGANGKYTVYNSVGIALLPAHITHFRKISPGPGLELSCILQDHPLHAKDPDVLRHPGIAINLVHKISQPVLHPCVGSENIFLPGRKMPEHLPGAGHHACKHQGKQPQADSGTGKSPPHPATTGRLCQAQMNHQESRQHQVQHGPQEIAVLVQQYAQPPVHVRGPLREQDLLRYFRPLHGLKIHGKGFLAQPHIEEQPNLGLQPLEPPLKYLV